MRYNWLSVLSILCAGPLCQCPLATPHSPLWDDMRLKHAWNAVPENWEILDHPPAGTTVDLYLALKSHRENALIDALYEVSNPRHPRYGLHLSKEQVAELVAPHPDTLELVNSWLEHHGVPSSSVSTTHGGSWLTLTGIPVSQANDLLGASYRVYQHAETKDCILRTVGYALPAVLHGHVQTVAPTTYFGSPHTLRQTPRKHSGEAAAALAKSASGELVKERSKPIIPVMPSDLRWLYNTLGYVPAAADKNMLGIAGFFGHYPRQEDLASFMEEHRFDVEGATFTLVRIGGGSVRGEPSDEASANIQYTEAIAFPTRQFFYSTSGGTENYLQWFGYMTSLPRVPQTITTSYGGEEQDFAEDYAIELCRLFMQLGVRGASVLVASGDHGVGLGNCIVNDGSGRVQFLPMFPASCPFVTTVGGTVDDDPEIGVAFSSGGFSNYFKRPTYQDKAVSTFLQKLGNQYHGLYNATSRGFPDIAAQAFNFEFKLNGVIRTMWGTSCAAPTVAGVISLLNDYLLSKGEHPLGWLNPWLYGDGLKGFNDITSGSNPGCGTIGFSAVVGWDPVTGLGTPDFIKLEEILDDTW